MGTSPPERYTRTISGRDEGDCDAAGYLMHHYPFHTSDYMMSTAHLSLEEDATYRRILDLYYSTELPIPTDNRAVSRRLRVPEILLLSVLEEFFFLHENEWHNRRCDDEIYSYRAMRERNSSNGKLGGRPSKSERLSVANRAVSQNNPLVTHSKANQEPRTKNHSNPVVPSGLDELFERFWRSYPNRKNKKGAAKAWGRLKLKPDDSRIQAMREGLAACKLSDDWIKDGGQFVPHAATWLNGERWKDEFPAEKTGLVL